MLYQRKCSLTYYQMGDYIDQNIYKEHHDPSKVFEYLYRMIYLLSTTKRLFNKHSMHDGFSVWLAGEIYSRIMYPKHYNCTEIKCVGAYIKSVVKLRSIDYAVKYSDYGVPPTPEWILSVPNLNITSVQQDNSVEVVDVFNQVFGFVLTEVGHCIFKSYDDYKNTITSTLLTINNIVLCGNDGEKDVILYGLCQSYKTLVLVCARQVLRRIKKQILEYSDESYKCRYSITWGENENEPLQEP